MAANEKGLIAGKWFHEPEEQSGDYWFGGQVYMTSNIQADIPEKELIEMITHIHKLAKERNGLDYLQVFTNAERDKIFVIDQIAKSQVETSPKEYHYCTILYDHEY